MCSTRWLVHNRYARGPCGRVWGANVLPLKILLPNSPTQAQRLLKIQRHWQCTLLGGWFTTATLGGPAGEVRELEFARK
jgi:hypothetical protein